MTSGEWIDPVESDRQNREPPESSLVKSEDGERCRGNGRYIEGSKRAKKTKLFKKS